MTLHRRIPRPRGSTLALAAVAGLLVALAAIQPAFGAHMRPAGATPLRLSFLPSYQPCPNPVVPAPTSAHGLGAFAPSCTPPVLESMFLGTGTPAGEGGPGAAANMTAFARFDALPGIAGNGINEADISIIGTVTDVRCLQNPPGLPSGQFYGCIGNGATGVAPGDYPGMLGLDMTLQITDHYNGPGAAGPPIWPAPCAFDGVPPQGAPVGCLVASSATTALIPVRVPVPCIPTPDLGPGADPPGTGDQIGSTCTFATTLDALFGPPGAVHDGVRASYQVDDAVYLDGGPDANPTLPPLGETTYLRQGLFAP